MIKERPILFSAPMVRAILAGTKSQTRRVVKWQGPKGFPHDFERAFTDNPAGIKRLMVPYHHPDDDYSDGVAHRHYPPHGDPGDRLWVRETHALIWPGESEPEKVQDCNVEYRADTNGTALPGQWPDECRGDPDCPKWLPSIHMPRWASRITLEITDVRVERLNDISEADAIAEGIDAELASRFVTSAPDRGTLRPATLHAFSGLWESINGPGSWALSPWVWCVSFKVMK